MNINRSVRIHWPPGRTNALDRHTFIIAQDALWMRENLEGYPAGLNFSVKSYFESADRLKSMADLEGAELFFGHDEQQWKEKGGRWYK